MINKVLAKTLEKLHKYRIRRMKKAFDGLTVEVKSSIPIERRQTIAQFIGSEIPVKRDGSISLGGIEEDKNTVVVWSQAEVGSIPIIVPKEVPPVKIENLTGKEIKLHPLLEDGHLTKKVRVEKI